MKMKSNLLIIVCLLLSVFVKGQLLGTDKKQFTHADTLRGSLNANRDWGDVMRYEPLVFSGNKKRSVFHQPKAGETQALKKVKKPFGLLT